MHRRHSIRHVYMREKCVCKNLGVKEGGRYSLKVSIISELTQVFKSILALPGLHACTSITLCTFITPCVNPSVLISASHTITYITLGKGSKRRYYFGEFTDSCRMQHFSSTQRVNWTPSRSHYLKLGWICWSCRCSVRKSSAKSMVLNKYIQLAYLAVISIYNLLT